MAKDKQLTARKVATLNKPGRYNDGHGLELQVSKWGTKAWIYRYQRHGEKRWMGLGAAHTVKLTEARERARQARLMVLDGRDPIDEKHAARKAAKLARAKCMTFRQCSTAYLEAHGDTWRNEKHRRQWAASVDRASDAFGNLPVGDINVGILTKFLTPIWRATPETGSRLRGRIEKVLDWATACEFRTGENPARWRGHLEHLLKAKPTIAHHAALPYAELPAFMESLRARSTTIARALELTVLTAARTGESLYAKWDEIDLANGLWVIPASRMKSAREHQVPLPDRALTILEELPRTSPYLFPGVHGTKPPHNAALLAELKEVHGNGFTVHGFRSTFSDWAHDCTNFSESVIEGCLAHAIKDKTAAAYRRRDALEKRRRLLADWTRYCGSPAMATSGKVVQLGAA